MSRLSTITTAGLMLIVGIAVGLSIEGSFAQQAGSQSHGKPAPAAASQSPSTKAFEAVNEKMHHDMAIAFTGDADVDFVRGMIPHHQGAVEMAEVVIRYGKDPDVKKLADEIIAAQKTELTFMKAWLAKRGL